MPSLLDVCPRGAWISEEHAVQFLGFSSKSALREAFLGGNLPHVFVDHGKRFGDNIKSPYSTRRFFFVQSEGKTVSRPGINLASWAAICQSLEGGSVDSLSQTAQSRIRDYTHCTDLSDAFRDLIKTHAIIFPSELSGEDGDDGYRYGANGSTVRKPSSTSSSKDEGEIYIREDGKKVRRVKRSNSSHSRADTLSGFLKKDENKTSSRKLSGSRSVGDAGSRSVMRSKSSNTRPSKRRGSMGGGSVGGDDLRRGVRRVQSQSAPAPAAIRKNPSLAGFLANDDDGDSRPKFSGSRSIGAAEGEIYTRADGKRGELNNENFRCRKYNWSQNRVNLRCLTQTWLRRERCAKTNQFKNSSASEKVVVGICEWDAHTKERFALGFLFR